MTNKVRVLAFAGSLRKDSFNKKLVKIAARAAEAAGAQVTVIDLADFPLPVFNQDDQDKNGIHENAKKLKKLMHDSDAFLIASPEYNSSISGALKNAIDWASRQEEGEQMLSCFRGKVAGIMSASPGALGGLRGLVHVRAILENIFVLVVTEQIAISNAPQAFTADGALVDGKQQQAVEKIAASVVRVTGGIKIMTQEHTAAR